MDDGTTVRLAPNHYIMITTIVAVEDVMTHLD
jgi:glycine cleavage system aminomethyltransferase T